MQIRSIFLGLALILPWCSLPQLHAAEPIPAGLSVAVTFTPAPSTPEAYLCKAEVTDLSTDVVLAKPQIINRRGEASKAVVGRKDSEITFEVSQSKDGNVGEYTVTYRNNGKVVSVHKGSITIR